MENRQGKERGILKEPRLKSAVEPSSAKLSPQKLSLGLAPSSPQTSVDRLSVTWADPQPQQSMQSSSANLFHLPAETAKNDVKMSTNTGEGSEDEDYSASLSAVLRQRRASSVRRSRKGRARRPSSPFVQDTRRSSVFTTSSGDTAISIDDGQTILVSQEEIFENIHLHKEVLGSVKQQPLGMRRKLKIVNQAKAYIKRHQGQLQERLAQSKSTRDIYARFNIVINAKWQHIKREAANLSNFLIPWELRIKEIESHFGSVVASYFTFLRWLFWVNLMIGFILMLFVIIPEYLTAKKEYDGERKHISDEDWRNATKLLTLWEFEGVLKCSPIFYGYYTNIEQPEYRMPLAYFLTGLTVYIYSFVATLRKMAENSRMSKLSEKDDECIFSWKLFTGWDFMIGNAETAHNRIASIILGFKEALLEEAEKKKNLGNWKIIALRAMVNICVVILLIASAYAVVTVVSLSDDNPKERSWWHDNQTTIVVTVISIMFPVFFELLGFLEHYHPRKQLRLQLARIMLLNLLNLYSLIFALFSKIEGMSSDLDLLQPKLGLNITNITVVETLPINVSFICREEILPCSNSTIQFYTRKDIPFESHITTPLSYTNTLSYVSSTDPIAENLMLHNQDTTPSEDFLNKNIPSTQPTDAIIEALEKEMELLRIRYGIKYNISDLDNYYDEKLFVQDQDAGNETDWDSNDYATNDSLKSMGLSITTEDYRDQTFYNEENRDQTTYNKENPENRTDSFTTDGTNVISISEYDITLSDLSTATTEIETSSEIFSSPYTENNYNKFDTVYNKDNIELTTIPMFTQQNYDTVAYKGSDTSINVRYICPEFTFNYTIRNGNSNITESILFKNCKKVQSTCYIRTCNFDNNVTVINTNNTQNSTVEVDIAYVDHYNRKMYNLTKNTKKKLEKLCWETMFGQELVKLTMMDLVFVLLGTLFMDFFRAIFVRYMNKCWCWNLEKRFPEYGDFKIAENILHLINNQGMVWMGMFFSPGLVVLNVVKLVIMMYLRSWAVMTCNVPHEVVFRVSKSNNFYLALLLTMLFLCVLPVGYSIVWIKPSWHCGPFSEYDKIYHILTTNIYKILPNNLNFALEYVTSPAIVIPLLVLLILIIYYLTSLTNSLREANNDLRIQLRRERTEERRKMFQLADTRRHAGSLALDNTPFARWKRALPALVIGKSIDSDDQKTGSVDDNQTIKRKASIFEKVVERAIKRKSIIQFDKPRDDVSSNNDDDADTVFHENFHKEFLKMKETKALADSKSKKTSSNEFVLSKTTNKINTNPSEEYPETAKTPLSNETEYKQVGDLLTTTNIPVITISHTESDDEILQDNSDKDTNSGKKMQNRPERAETHGNNKTLKRQKSVESFQECQTKTLDET